MSSLIAPLASCDETAVPRGVTLLAQALSELHGPAIIRNESSGYHIYLPSPACLEVDGRKELQSKHLTVNASRYLELDGGWTKKLTGKNKDKDFSAICHKTDTRYRVSDLLNPSKYPPLEKRGINNVHTHVTNTANNSSASLVDDGTGNMIPIGPGLVTPITELPPRHPAVEYLTNRGYDLNMLYQQFNCSYCTAETPEDDTKGIYYKKLPADFRDTPQGRIIFYVLMNGVQVGWQARIIDRVVGDTKEYLHPYSNRWVPMEHKDRITNKWTTLPGVDVCTERYTCLWKPSKYKTAFGAMRNQLVMGYDAALVWNRLMKFPKPIAILGEGPLDAGRFGLGGVAMLGKYLSDFQADSIARKFKKLIVVSDNDKAGMEATQRIKEVMADKMVELVFAEIPSNYKDAGDITTMDALHLIGRYLN